MANRIEIKQEFRYSLQSQQVLTIAFICSVIIFILMSVCLMSSYWITAEGFRQGLLYLCIEEPSSTEKSRYEPLPFDLNKEELEPGCYPNRDKGKSQLASIHYLLVHLKCNISNPIYLPILDRHSLSQIMHLSLSHMPTLSPGLCLSHRTECTFQGFKENELHEILHLYNPCYVDM